MDLCVLLALVLDVLPYCFLVPVFANGIHIVPAGPEVASPEHFLDLGVKAEHLFGSNAFRGFHDLSWRHHGYGLNEEVNMILICSDFDVIQFVALLDFVTDILESLFVLFCEYLPAIFCRANEVIKKKSDVVAFVNVLAAHTRSLPRFTHLIAL
jgi:hypothetical protein